jgi:hypothetical protein
MEQAYDHAMAVRSEIVLALGPDVERTAWPVWTEYVGNDEKVTCGMCPFPLRVPIWPDKPSFTTYVRTPATRSPDDGMAPAMVGRELYNDVAVHGYVQPDNAPNDDARITITRATHVAHEDDKVSHTQSDNVQSDDDRANEMQKWASEKRMQVGANYVDDHVTIPQPDDEEEDDDQITPVATQLDASSQDSDAYLTDPGADDQFYELRMMVWVGCVTSCNVPARLKGAPEPCLARRRIVRDMEDNIKTLEDTYTVVYTCEHFSRRLCDVLHLLEVALIYCDHPQYNVTRTAEVCR